MPVTRQLFRLFLWHALRDVLQHPLLGLLNLGSIALGVAVYMAIQVATQSASRAFNASIDVVGGKAQLEVASNSNTLDEKIFPTITNHPDVEAATPILRSTLFLPHLSESLDLVGIDLFSNLPFATFVPEGDSEESFDVERWLGTPGGIGLTSEFAKRHNLKIGDSVTARARGQDHPLTVIGILDLKDSPAGTNSRFAAMDLGWMQQLLGRQGVLSSIQIRVRNPENLDLTIAELKPLVPPDATVGAPAQRGLQVQKMLSGFSLNLTALSLISLLVGMFLIYNTVSASTVRRRVETGILRAIGASRAEILLLFLGESLISGLLGVTLGVIGGTLLANSLVATISSTISSLYVLVQIDQAHVGWEVVARSCFFGLGSVLLAAVIPAWEGARMQPVESLHPGHASARARTRHGLWLVCSLFSGVLVLASGYGALQWVPWLGFATAFFVLLAFAMLMPSTALLFSRCLLGAKRHLPILLSLAAQNLARGIHRTAVTCAALMAASAMTVGISVMIFSFRETVNHWVNHTVQADLFIASSSTVPSDFLPMELIRELRKDPAIATVETFREIALIYQNSPTYLGVIDGARNRQLRFIGGSNERKTDALSQENSLAVTESFARRFQVKEGEMITLPTPKGEQSFKIIGVFYDYTRDQGAMLMLRKNFDRFWSAPEANTLAVYVKDQSKLAEVEDSIRRRFSPRGELTLFSNQGLRDRIFEIFDQTFAVTYVLRTIALIVAGLGILLTFTIAVKERDRELALLRASGASRGQLEGLIMAECGMTGLLSGVAGVFAGLALSVVLTAVINKAFFGWTIALSIPWTTVLATPFWMLGASLLAGWIPAWRAGHASIATALRSE